MTTTEQALREALRMARFAVLCLRDGTELPDTIQRIDAALAAPAQDDYSQCDAAWKTYIDNLGGAPLAPNECFRAAWFHSKLAAPAQAAEPNLLQRAANVLDLCVPLGSDVTADYELLLADLRAALAAAPQASEPCPHDWHECDTEQEQWCAICGEYRTLPAAPAATVPDDTRECTCHPDDNPPATCQRKFALSECIAAATAPAPQGDGALTDAARLDAATVPATYVGDGMFSDESVAVAAARWANWCDYRGMTGLPAFLRKVAALRAEGGGQ